MNNKFNYLIQETRKLIGHKSRIFIINTLILSMIFLIMNFFTIGKYNLNNIEAYLARNIQIKLLLKDNIQKESIIAFEKELINVKNIDYHSYSAKELAIKTLEKKMKLNLSQRNPLKNSITIYTKDIENIAEVEALAGTLKEKDIVDKVLFNKELVDKLIKSKKTMSNLKLKINIFFTIPLFIFVYLVFKLNFINYEDELNEKYRREGRGLHVISPYLIKKVINIVLAWFISIIVFGSFYQGAEKILYSISPSISVVIYESLPKSLFINQLLISIILLILSGMFIRIKEEDR